jgi:hypothetical protein
MNPLKKIKIITILTQKNNIKINRKYQKIMNKMDWKIKRKIKNSRHLKIN